MIRTGVFIGVDKTGTLQCLNDAAAGARRMHAWALFQGLPDKSHAKLITDEGGKPVTPDDIYDAIKAIVDGPGADQLIIYFAGHGVNINRNEHWLLTDAPIKTSAAINVTGSVELARYCGIQHVIIISDACRVAPEGIQAQNVRGVDVFPNDGTGQKAKPVDQFYACMLGRTAAELKDPSVASSNYSALYTDALLEALSGNRPELLEPPETNPDGQLYIRPWTLQTYLENEVPSRVQTMHLENKVNQHPDAIITSRSAWLARIQVPPVSNRYSPDSSAVVSGSRRSQTTGSSPTIPTLSKVVGRPLSSTIDEGQSALAAYLALPFDRNYFETKCGIKVRGARIVDAFASGGNFKLAGIDSNTVCVDELSVPAASVLLVFDGNLGTVVPVIKGFITTLTLSEHELINVAYEPSMNTGRWEAFSTSATELRKLRALVTSAFLHNRFRPDGRTAAQLEKNLRYGSSVDPTLAIYVAYAYHDLQSIERINKISNLLRDDVGVTVFDLELLGKTLVNKHIKPVDGVIPFVPMLSQGWALLHANRVTLHPALKGVESTVCDSLWSLYDLAGLNKLRIAMQTAEVL